MFDKFDWIGLWQDPNIKSALLSFVGAILTELGRRAIMPRATVAWGVAHQHCFIISAPEQQQILVRTRQIFVQNTGRESAENVELTFNFKPQCLDLWPPTIGTVDQRDRFVVINVANLNKKELFTADIINHAGELPDVVAVRWKGGIAKQKILGPVQVYPRWAQRLVAALILLGAVASIFLLIRTIIALA